ncbi:MAG: von Willebrand factor type A domain-containing protein, partial [Cytophagales bacterium]|nr:von Willebrand factor type A domain-containing protein [Cytophagales bacterium]
MKKSEKDDLSTGMAAPSAISSQFYNTGPQKSMKTKGAPARLYDKLGEYEETSDINITTTEFNTESYNLIRENEFLAAKENPLSTFSIDVDAASYSNSRRYLE